MFLSLMNTYKKTLIVLCLVIVVIPVVLISVLLTSPPLLLKVANHFSPYALTAQSIRLGLSSPRLMLSGLNVGTEQKTIASIEDLDIQTTWGRLLGGEGVVLGSVSGAEIFPENIPSSQDVTNDQSGKNASTEPLVPEQLLQEFQVSLSDINVIWPNRQLVIESITPMVVDKRSQGIDFSVRYTQIDTESKQTILPLQGKLSLENIDDVPQVSVKLSQLDLRNILSSAPKDQAEPAANQSNQVETVIDWTPVFSAAPLVLSIQLEQLQIPQGDISDIETTIKIATDRTLSYQHQGQWSVNINDDYRLNHPVSLEGQWQAVAASTQGTDLRGNTNITIGEAQLSAAGEVNVNGIVGQKLQLSTGFKQFPLEAMSVQAKDLVKQVEPYLPLKSNVVLSTQGQQVTISELQVTANQSDINGSVTADTRENFTQLEKLVFDLTANQLVIPASNKANANQQTTKKGGQVFNDQPLSTQWLTMLNLQGKLNIGLLQYGERPLLEGLSAQWTLENGELKVSNTIDDFAQGKVNSLLQLTQKNDQLQLAAKGSVNGLLLESLALLPEGEFSGGKTSLDFDVSSQGNSTRAIAGQLEGGFLLAVSEGVIANNSFEVVGSDLLLSIINSINPFHKKAKNTQLECAVVKSRIEQGKLLFKDSVAIKTSKMIVVADGEVDLGTEKINLGINPKARSGVGLDIASLAKFVALKGTLTDPGIGASGKGALKSLVNIGAAISTGGASLLASNLFSKATSGEVCDVARQAFTKN